MAVQAGLAGNAGIKLVEVAEEEVWPLEEIDVNHSVVLPPQVQFKQIVIEDVFGWSSVNLVDFPFQLPRVSAKEVLLQDLDFLGKYFIFT